MVCRSANIPFPEVEKGQMSLGNFKGASITEEQTWKIPEGNAPCEVFLYGHKKTKFSTPTIWKKTFPLSVRSSLSFHSLYWSASKTVMFQSPVW